MSSPPPTKPPRGVKQGKETSGLLMSVIRTLSASETNEQREKERAKLEKEYKKSDARLDELVAAHAQEIMDVMQKFSSVSSALSAWTARGDAAAARLAACRGLLRLRRADLRRLWADARAHHHALAMLSDIERVVVSERETRAQLSAGRVLGAAGTLRAALAAADCALAHVHALHSTRDHLQAMKLELVDAIVRRLSDAVYRSERAPLSRRVSARRRTALLLAELTKSAEVTDAYLQDITPEFEASLSEEDSTFETTVMISLEALGVLDQLTEATEKFKIQIQPELLEVIDIVSRRIIDEGDVEEGEGEAEGEGGADGEGEVGPLARLVASLGDEFRACGARHRRLLQLWRAALLRRHYAESHLYTEHQYWSAVQQVLQLLLTEYLEIESVTLAARGGVARTAPAGGAGGAGGAELRLSEYFAKKRPQRRRSKLFKLTPASTLSPSVGARRHGYPLVCAPDPAQLHAVLPALHALCADIEPVSGGGECSLRAFITDYVRTGETERLANGARLEIEAAMRAPAAWRERDATGQAARALLACVARGWATARGAAVAARRCGPGGGAHAARAAQAALAALATQCRAAESRLMSARGAGGARAARWLADDDIVRFLQALPNWQLATAADHTKDAQPQAQELKQAYEREAEILGSSLGDGALSRGEIIADGNALVDLAVLCESMDWLSANIKTIPSIISAPAPDGGAVKLSDKFLNDIASAALIFDEISHKCLLLLHLEMRIECFYYLGQEERVGSDAGSDSGGGAGLLAHALLTFHEQASAVLPAHRLAYIFNGVGEMMSAAVVWRWQEGEGGAASGAAAGGRLATLRHCLAALQLPHSGLHRAHTYLHLLNCSPQEIIASVREKGAQFSELEYLNAFKVIGARRGLAPADMRAHLKQLSAALGHVGVTV